MFASLRTGSGHVFRNAVSSEKDEGHEGGEEKGRKKE
jgi:hypothetical protein